MKHILASLFLIGVVLAGARNSSAAPAHATCVAASEYCNGANVFVTCIQADGTSVGPIEIGSAPFAPDTVNMNALVLSFMTTRNVKKKKGLVLDLDYDTGPPVLMGRITLSNPE